MIIGEVLFSASQIEDRVVELAEDITRDMGSGIVAVGVLKGAFVFLADLIRKLPPDTKVDFLEACSYGDSLKSKGVVDIKTECSVSLEDQKVLIVEDIIDTGYTIQIILEYIRSLMPKEVKVCSLLDKKSARKVDVQADFVGFQVPELFVVGYGIDCADEFRALPYISYIRDSQ